MFGAIILMISNVAVKLIGALLRIPLTNIMGVEGMAYYNAAYSIYASFYTVSTAGIPVAVSRMIATANSKNNDREIRRIFKVAFCTFFVIGIVGMSAMMIFSHSFASYSKMPDSYLAMLAIAPTIFFICLSSAYRGYFQGLQNMIPTAVSQVIESAVKLIIGIFAAIYFTRRGYPAYKVASFVVMGVTVGVLLGAVYGAVAKAMFTRSRKDAENTLSQNIQPRKNKEILCELISIAIPITLASSIMGLTNFADTMIFARGLQSTGIPEKAATAFYGTYTSMVYPLFNLVPPFIYTFGISAIPAISASISVGNRQKAQRDIESAFRNCAIIAIPCAIGMATLSNRIISFLFKDEIISYGENTVSSVKLASPALSAIAVGILFLGVISITNSVLQACNEERTTIISTFCGIIVKVIATYFLSRIPNFGLLGAAFGTLLCYFTIMCFNLFFMFTKTGFIPKARKIFVKPLISGVLCGLFALVSSSLLPSIVSSEKLVTLVSICIAGFVYVVSLILFKGINRYDVMMMPKGEKLCAILDKFNLLEGGESGER